MFVCGECGATQPMPGHCGVDGSALAPIGDDLLLGTSVGPYRIARLMGVGGMGRVYKGVHPQIGSRVAIKVLSRECTDRRDLVERFFAEARAANLIRHESIVNVLDQAMLADGRPYIVMEYLDGSSLAAILDDARQMGSRLPLGGIARLIVEVLEALGAAHAKGIIHRDLKPDNIYVTPQGRAKVLDFGIAKLVPELGGSSTHTGSLLGTPHYMSPEQAGSRPIDARADLYAIGVILFECATLQRPFSAPALFDLLRMHIEATPPSPRALRGDMPDGMEQVIYCALAKLPEQRFGSAQAMSTALQQATAGLPGEAWEPLLPSRSARPSSPAAWAPTPPASWAGSRARNVQEPTPSTQTAGQIAKMPAQKRSKLPLVILGVALAGGGAAIALAVSAGGGAAKSGPVIANGSGSGSGSAVGMIEPVVIDAAPVEIVAPPSPPSREAELTPAQAAQMDQMLAMIIGSMGPEDLAELPPELVAALKKYGAWSKIPKAERMKLLNKVSGSLGLTVTGGDLDLFGGALEAERPPPAPAAPRAPSGWVESGPLKIPGAFDPKRASFGVLLAWATKEAQRLVVNATLIRADAPSIGRDGLADVTADELEFRFKVPGRPEDSCMFKISVDGDGAHVAPMDRFACAKLDPVPAPRCSLTQVWTKAGYAAGTRADVSYRAFGGKVKWYVRSADIHTYQALADDC